MPKLLWVALPLLLAAGLIATQALRRRPLSRHAVNVWSSVLLLAYVLTTAGLGIFWVANQQLPVFDWHYLFGYGTVLLVALHLAFNFRTVWRYLVRPGIAPAATRADAGPGRRGARRSARPLRWACAMGAASCGSTWGGKAPAMSRPIRPQPGWRWWSAFTPSRRTRVKGCCCAHRASTGETRRPPSSATRGRRRLRCAHPARRRGHRSTWRRWARRSGTHDRRDGLAQRPQAARGALSGALFSTELY